MLRNLSEMIEHTSIKHTQLMRRLSAPLQQHFGINYFCYQFVSHEGAWFTVSSCHEWILYSAENKFYLHDPSLVQPRYYTSSVCFPKNHQHDIFQETLIEHAIKRFNLDHCLAIIEPHVLGCDYYFFGAPSEHTQITQIYLTQLSRLRYDFTKYVQEEIKAIHPQWLEHSVNLQEINPERFYTTEHLLMLKNDLAQSQDFLSSIQKQPILTLREQQCLQLFQQGFTAKQTACQLGLSYRTIEDYFEKIKNKYGVEYKRELLNFN